MACPTRQREYNIRDGFRRVRDAMDVDMSGAAPGLVLVYDPGGDDLFVLRTMASLLVFAVYAEEDLPEPGTPGRAAYDSTTHRPVWDDGEVWRYADGTPVGGTGFDLTPPLP